MKKWIGFWIVMGALGWALVGCGDINIGSGAQNTPTDPGTGSLLLPSGAACKYDRECQSGNCENGGVPGVAGFCQ